MRGFTAIELILVLFAAVIIATVVLMATTGGDSTLVHNTDVSTERGQVSISNTEHTYVLLEDGMYQEVRIDIVLTDAGTLYVARTPGSVTPVSIAVTQ